jgi:class 3 adenylate cyclase
MLPVRASVPGLAADLTGLTGLVPEPNSVEDLYDVVGTYTGLGPASPLTAEIVDVAVAAATAAMLIERPSSGGTIPRRAPWRDLPAGSRAWPDLAAEIQARLTGRSSRPDVARLSLARKSALPTDGQMCAVFAVDIAGFTRPDRDDDIRLYLHEKLYEYLQVAFDNSGIPWQGCFNEDRGDGALIVVPPGISFKGLIHPLPERLRDLIRRHNHVSRESAAIQLRAAAHIGPVDHDGHGFVGTDVNFAFRMLEARSVKRMLAASGAELCLAVSDYVYHSFVCHYPSLVHPDTFRTVRFQVKNTRARAWTYLPGASS